MRLLIAILLALFLCIPLGTAIRSYVMAPYSVTKGAKRRRVKCWKHATPKRETVIDWCLL